MTTLNKQNAILHYQNIKDTMRRSELDLYKNAAGNKAAGRRLRHYLRDIESQVKALKYMTLDNDKIKC